MAKIFVLTEENRLAESISRFLKYTRGIKPIHILLGSIQPKEQWVLQAFRQIADSIEDNKGESGLRNAIAIVDFCDENWSEIDLAKLNPIQAGAGSWATVVAMLILTFPEIHWVFITPYKPINEFLFGEAHMFTPCRTLSEILQIHDEGFTPLFDPTNLRNTIRSQVKNTGNGKVASYIPLRKRTAAAIDEEEPYAYFNAYTAYRFGYRSHLVTSERMM
ncbi:MAG: hypothetical protein QXN89_03765, partial [Candidatus Woesearchaeota archaeon]